MFTPESLGASFVLGGEHFPSHALMSEDSEIPVLQRRVTLKISKSGDFLDLLMDSKEIILIAGISLVTSGKSKKWLSALPDMSHIICVSSSRP